MGTESLIKKSYETTDGESFTEYTKAISHQKNLIKVKKLEEWIDRYFGSNRETYYTNNEIYSIIFNNSTSLINILKDSKKQ